MWEGDFPSLAEVSLRTKAISFHLSSITYCSGILTYTIRIEEQNQQKVPSPLQYQAFQRFLKG